MTAHVYDDTTLDACALDIWLALGGTPPAFRQALRETEFSVLYGDLLAAMRHCRNCAAGVPETGYHELAAERDKTRFATLLSRLGSY